MKLKGKFNSLLLTIGFGSIVFLVIIIFFNFNSNFSVQNSLAKTGAPLVKAASVRFIIP